MAFKPPALTNHRKQAVRNQNLLATVTTVATHCINTENASNAIGSHQPGETPNFISMNKEIDLIIEIPQPVF